MVAQSSRVTAGMLAAVVRPPEDVWARMSWSARAAWTRRHVAARRAGRLPPPTKSRGGRHTREKVVKYVEDTVNMGSRMTVEDFANDLHISPNTFMAMLRALDRKDLTRRIRQQPKA